MSPNISTGTMADTAIGGLPGELRNKIYEFVLDVDLVAGKETQREGHCGGLKVSQHDRERGIKLPKLLATLQVCGQMRREAAEFLFENPIELPHQQMSEAEEYSPMGVPTTSEVLAWTAMMAKIPMQLRSPRLTFEYRHKCAVSLDDTVNRKKLQGEFEFNRQITALVEAALPHEVVVVIIYHFNTTSLFKASRDDFFCNGRKNPKSSIVCDQDEPMTPAECENIRIKIPTSDAVRAHRLVAEEVADKRRRLEAHSSHRMCFIRLDLGKALERLKIAEKKTLGMMEHLPGFPKTPKTA